jgi:folate-binding protein YgfZ
VTAGYDALRTGAAVTVAAGVVLATGPDAGSFLQSLVSADLDPLRDGEGTHTLLLTPQGKLDVDARALRVGGDRWVLLTEGSTEAARLLESLLRFRIRVDVELSDASDRVARRAVRGPDAHRVAAEALGVAAPSTPHGHVEAAGLRVVRADWPGLPGVEVLGAPDAVETAAQALRRAGAVDAQPSDLEIVRVEAGVPAPGRELDGSVIPQEAFLERDAISFTKGCFLGQELACRIDTRGHVNRYLRGVRAGAPVAAGAEITAGGKVVGRVTSAVQSPRFGPIGLAYVRREVEPPAPVDVGGTGATVQALPFV